MVWDLLRTKKEKPAAGKTGYWRTFWRRRWDSNPRTLADQTISSRSRYDHFDTSPYLSQHQHLRKRGELMGRTKKNIQLKIPEKPRKIKGFRSGSYRMATTISSQGRYDHFDTPPYRTFSLYQRSGKKSRIIFLPNQLQNLFQILADAAVIFPAVGPQAGRAVLDPLFCVPEIAPAPISQGIQGAVAEHAAKVLRVSTLVAGKIFTFPILIKIIMAHGFLHSPLSHLF